MREELIAEYLAREICGKGVLWSKDYRFSQTVENITAGSHYTECLHEIAHWIASDPRFRGEDNLGLSEDDVGKDHPCYWRMYTEESVASALTKMLFYKYFSYDHLSGQDNERKYMDYIDDRCKQICLDHKIDESEIRERAKSLFEEYTSKIPDPRMDPEFSSVRD